MKSLRERAKLLYSVAFDANDLADAFEKIQAETETTTLVKWNEKCYQTGYDAGLEAAAVEADRVAGNDADFDRYVRKGAGIAAFAIRALMVLKKAEK